MKKLLTIIATMALLIAVAMPIQAATYTFQPSPVDMWDLSHSFAYSWGLEWNHPEEVVTEVTLTFNNIYNWQPEENFLYMHLLDDADIGTFRVYDYLVDPVEGDYFEGQGALIDIWSDPVGGGPGIDLSYSLNDLGLIGTFNEYASDGVFGFGIDADCHYYNDSVELKVTTTAVPEPASVLLVGLGLAGMGLYFRRK